jgi:hypothetical protein
MDVNSVLEGTLSPGMPTTIPSAAHVRVGGAMY